ncbi:MAG TPA: SIMPL domain-containing protein [Marmoricola sp.]
MGESKGRGWIAAIVGVGAVAVLAVVLGALALGAGGNDDGATPPAETTRPSIVMTGDGVVTGVPDQLSFTVRVSVTRSDVSAAMDGASSTMKSVYAALGKQGVKKADMQTTGVSVTPSYDYSSSTPRLVGYHASQSARIKVDDLRKAGATLSAATTAGGNAVRVSSVSLGIADRDALLARARRAAVADARMKASEYATAGGQKLGRVLSLKEVSTVAPQPQRLEYASALKGLRADTATVPIKAGQKDLKVQIRVVWELS